MSSGLMQNGQIVTNSEHEREKGTARRDGATPTDARRVDSVDLVLDLTAPEARVEVDDPRVGRQRTALDVALDRWATRTLDLLVSLALLVLLAPMLLVIAVSVRSTSEGPVLFRQVRCGRGGRSFTMLKFRTMVAGADREAAVLAASTGTGRVAAPAYKAADDPRVTPLGRALRRTSLDELPQLFNVLAGRMSLVGPRPLVWSEAEVLGLVAFTLRHAVNPGVTGSWQVERTSTTSYVERIAMDVDYATTRTVSKDVGLLMRTPLSVFRGEGCF